MQISIRLNNSNDLSETKKGILGRIRTSICAASIWNCFVLLLVVVVFLLTVFVGKAYIGSILTWLERQDAVIIYVVIVVLFTVVSFPISVGYIVVVIAAGYLFGIVIGLVLSVIGANLGLLIAHYIMRAIGRHSTVNSYLTSDTAKAIIRVISGQSSFKIVVCARLTPIPFGLQNGIFALSNVSAKVYHLASFLGLLPGQIVGTYLGSSLRSIQDVLDNRQISAFTYVLATIQLVVAVGLLIWIGSLARRELSRAIAQADVKFGGSGDGINISNFNIV